MTAFPVSSSQFPVPFSPLVVLALVVTLAPALAGGDDEIFLEGRETFKVETPVIEMTRPDGDWVFIDVEKQREIALKSRPPPSVQDEFGNLRARIHNASQRALVSVYVNRCVGTPPDAARLEADLRAELALRKGAQLVEAGRVQLAGSDAAAARLDWVATVDKLPVGQREVPGGGASNVYYYSKIDSARPQAGVVVSFLFECPKDRYARAKPGWLKFLKKLKLG